MRTQVVFPLITYVLIYHLLSIVLRQTMGLDSMVSYLITSVICIALLYNTYREEVRLPIAQNKTTSEKREILKDLSFSIFTIVVGILINISLTKVLPFISTSGFESSSRILMDGSFIVRLIASGITVPILEELLFRGLILDFLNKNVNQWLSIILSTIIFGIFHFNLVQFLYAFLVGIFLGYSYVKSKKLLVPVISHVGLNTIVMIYSALMGG